MRNFTPCGLPFQLRLKRAHASSAEKLQMVHYSSRNIMIGSSRISSRICIANLLVCPAWRPSLSIDPSAHRPSSQCYRHVLHTQIAAPSAQEVRYQSLALGLLHVRPWNHEASTALTPYMTVVTGMASSKRPRGTVENAIIDPDSDHSITSSFTSSIASSIASFRPFHHKRQWLARNLRAKTHQWLTDVRPQPLHSILP